MQQQNTQNTDSLTFNIDSSQQYTLQQQQARTNQNMFTKDKQIIQDKQPRKVIYGQLQKQQQTIYQILQPYLLTMASSTGTLANYAGKGIYQAVKNTASWLYSKFTTTVVPYAQQQLPKLIFVIRQYNQNKNVNRVQSSESYQVIEIQDEEYKAIKEKQEHRGKKRIVVPLDKEQDPKFVEFLKKQNYVYDYSFPIDCQSQCNQQEDFMIPSAQFTVLHEEVKKKYQQQYQKSKAMKVVDDQQLQQTTKQLPKQQQQPITTNQQNYYTTNLSQFNQPKKCIKLKDCLIFEYEGKNSIEYDLLDNIERDQNTQFGYLMQPQKIISSYISSDGSYSGQAPVLKVEEQEEKVVQQVKNKKIRVEIPKEKLERNRQKKQEGEENEERELEYA